MFVYSFKLQVKKVLIGSCIGLGVLLCAMVWSSGKVPVIPSSGSQSTAKVIAGESNQQRVDFLKSYGWDINEQPVEVMEVNIPKKFDDVYENYNKMQKDSGFDLDKLKGKRIKRYTYLVLNYPDKSVEAEVRANVFVYEGYIVGADIMTTELDGFMHGINKK